MNLQEQMDLQQQFEAAVQQVNNLPADTAPQHMTELYGLYKQATDGDVNMGTDEVDSDAADNPNGPAGLSQAQWESWNQFKGLPEEEAKRRYVAKAAEVAGPAGTEATLITGIGQPASAPAAAGTGGQAPATENTTTARQADSGPGQSAQGGLRGDITGGAPYGGEDALKGAQ